MGKIVLHSLSSFDICLPTNIQPTAVYVTALALALALTHVIPQNRVMPSAGH